MEDFAMKDELSQLVSKPIFFPTAAKSCQSIFLLIFNDRFTTIYCRRLVSLGNSHHAMIDAIYHLQRATLLPSRTVWHYKLADLYRMKLADMPLSGDANKKMRDWSM